MRLTQLRQATDAQVKQAILAHHNLALQPPPPFMQEPNWPWCPEWIIPLHRHVPDNNDAMGIQRQGACERLPRGSGERHNPLVDRAREDRLNYSMESGWRTGYDLDPPVRWTSEPQGATWIEMPPFGRVYLKSCAKRPTWEDGYIPLTPKQCAAGRAGDIVVLAWVRGAWVSFLYWAPWEQFCWTQKKQDWRFNPADPMLHVPIKRARPIVQLVADLAATGWHLTPQQIAIPYEELL